MILPLQTDQYLNVQQFRVSHIPFLHFLGKVFVVEVEPVGPEVHCARPWSAIHKGRASLIIDGSVMVDSGGRHLAKTKKKLQKS